MWLVTPIRQAGLFLHTSSALQDVGLLWNCSTGGRVPEDTTIGTSIALGRSLKILITSQVPTSRGRDRNGRSWHLVYAFHRKFGY